MRLIRLLLATLAAVTLTVAPPSQAAGITSVCVYTSGARGGDVRTGTLESGYFTATDGTSPEVVCSVQLAPTPDYQNALVAKHRRGLACVASTCDGDYWVCAVATCDGDGFVCAVSQCDSGSVCVVARCVPFTRPGGSPATRLEPTAVEYVAPPQAQLFSCTNVRWHTAGGGYSQQFLGCTAIQG